MLLIICIVLALGGCCAKQTWMWGWSLLFWKSLTIITHWPCQLLMEIFFQAQCFVKGKELTQGIHSYIYGDSTTSKSLCCIIVQVSGNPALNYSWLQFFSIFNCERSWLMKLSYKVCVNCIHLLSLKTTSKTCDPYKEKKYYQRLYSPNYSFFLVWNSNF